MGAYEQSLGISSVGTLASYRSTPRVAYYDCSDDGTAGLQDSEGTNHLTENGSSAATFGNTGINGDCIRITGSSDYFYLQSSNLCPSTSEEWVLSLWLKPDTSSRRIFAMLCGNLSNATPNVYMAVDGADTFRCIMNNATVWTQHSGS